MIKLLQPFLITSLILTTSLNNIYAAEPAAVQVKKNQPCPFDGVLLSTDAANKAVQNLVMCEKIQEDNESLQQSVSLYKVNEAIYTKETNELKAQNVQLDTALQKANSNSFLVKALWFGIGVLVTGAAVRISK
jgi:hypothetical protein